MGLRRLLCCFWVQPPHWQHSRAAAAPDWPAGGRRLCWSQPILQQRGAHLVFILYPIAGLIWALADVSLYFVWACNALVNYVVLLLLLQLKHNIIYHPWNGILSPVRVNLGQSRNYIKYRISVRLLQGAEKRSNHCKLHKLLSGQLGVQTSHVSPSRSEQLLGPVALWREGCTVLPPPWRVLTPC